MSNLNIHFVRFFSFNKFHDRFVFLQVLSGPKNKPKRKMLLQLVGLRLCLRFDSEDCRVPSSGTEAISHL